MTEPGPVRRRAGRPTRAQAEARHEELLDTALELFLEHGYTLATIEMIATRVNMTKRTVYARYPDKAALFLAAVHRAIERQVVPPELLADLDNGDLAETLEGVARLRIAQIMTPHGLRLQRVINAESYRFPEIFASHYALSAGPVVDFVAGVLERAAADGRITPTNFRQVARAFTSMAVGGQTRAIVAGLPPTPEQIDERVAFTVRLLLEGLLPR